MSDPLLVLGSKGEDVATAKRLLNFHLYPLPPLANLNEFDSDTRDRTIAFQTMTRLFPDGKIGHLTTEQLLRFGRMNLDGAVSQQTPPFGLRKSFVPELVMPPLPSDAPRLFQTAPYTVPRLGQPAPYTTPDWFYNRLPSQSLTLDNVQLSLGNETDIVKGSDSSPIQFSAEFIYLKKRDDNPQWSHGFQFSHTPRSDDGRWSGQVYGKVGLSDWPVQKLGRISLTNPSLQAYVKKATESPWLVGGQIGNESDVTLFEEQGSYNLSMFLNVAPLQVDFFNIDQQRFTCKAESIIGLGFKLTLFTPRWTGPPPGYTP